MIFFPPLRVPRGLKRIKKFNATSVISAGGEDVDIKTVTTFDTIEKYDLTVVGSGNATFGTLTLFRDNGVAFASQKNGGRWCYAGGSTDGTGVLGQSTVYYVSPKTGGASSSWGNMTDTRSTMSGCSNAFEGHVISGVNNVAVNLTTIDKIWIMNNGTKTNFGSVTSGNTHGESYATQQMMYAFARGHLDQIEVKAFKNDSVMKVFPAVMAFGVLNTSFCCNDVLGLTVGGHDGINAVNYITQLVLKTISKCVDFGDLVVAKQQTSSACNQKRALAIKGADISDVDLNTIEYISFQSKSNAKSFGAIGVGKRNMDSYGAA